MASGQYTELKALNDELNEMRQDVYQNLLRQGRTDIDIMQINIQKCLSSGKVRVTIDAARGTTSSDEIRQSVCNN